MWKKFRLQQEKYGEKKAQEKLTNKKNEIAAEIIFQDIIREVKNRRNNIKSIDTWCQKTTKVTKVNTNKKDAIDHRKVQKEMEKKGTMKPLTNWFTSTAK